MSQNCKKGVMFERDFCIYFSETFSKVRGGGWQKRVQKRVNSLERNESEISNKRFLHLLQWNF